MKLTQKILSLGLLALGLSACGGGGSSAPAPGYGYYGGPTAPAQVSALNYAGGSCGRQVVIDYSSMTASCHNSESLGGKRVCKQAAEVFLSHYPGISCRVVARSASKGTTRRVMITAPSIERQIDLMTAQGV